MPPSPPSSHAAKWLKMAEYYRSSRAKWIFIFEGSSYHLTFLSPVLIPSRLDCTVKASRLSLHLLHLIRLPVLLFNTFLWFPTTFFWHNLKFPSQDYLQGYNKHLQNTKYDIRYSLSHQIDSDPYLCAYTLWMWMWMWIALISPFTSRSTFYHY